MHFVTVKLAVVVIVPTTGNGVKRINRRTSSTDRVA